MLRLAAILGVFALSGFSQAVVERAILGTASSTAATGAKGAGAASAGVFDSLQKTISGANQSTSKSTAAPAAKRASTAGARVTVKPVSREPAPVVEPKDLSGIAVGLTREELIDKYGQPAFKTIEPERGYTIETYTYMQSRRDGVTVTLRDGVVTSRIPPSSGEKQAGPAISLR